MSTVLRKRFSGWRSNKLEKKFWKSFLTYQRLRIFLKGRVSIHLEHTMLLYNIIKGYTVTEFKDLFLLWNSSRRRNENILLPRPEMNFIRNSISYREAIAWNSLTNKETRAKTLKELKRCLAKFDTDKMNFEAIFNIFSSLNFQLYKNTTLILVTTIGYKHFKQFLIFNCTYACAFSTPYFSWNCCLHDPTSYTDYFYHC